MADMGFAELVCSVEAKSLRAQDQIYLRDVQLTEYTFLAIMRLRGRMPGRRGVLLPQTGAGDRVEIFKVTANLREGLAVNITNNKIGLHRSNGVEENER